MRGLTYLPLLCLDTEKSLQKKQHLFAAPCRCKHIQVSHNNSPDLGKDPGEPLGCSPACWAQTKLREGCTPSWHPPGISHGPKTPRFCAQGAAARGHTCAPCHPGSASRWRVLCREKTQAQKHKVVDESNAGTIRSIFSRNYMAKAILILENPAPGPWFDPMTQALALSSMGFWVDNLPLLPPFWETFSLIFLDIRLIASDARRS